MTQGRPPVSDQELADLVSWYNGVYVRDVAANRDGVAARVAVALEMLQAARRVHFAIMAGLQDGDPLAALDLYTDALYPGGDPPTPPNVTTLDGERPEPVRDWIARWQDFKPGVMPDLVEFDVIAWIYSLELTVSAARAILKDHGPQDVLEQLDAALTAAIERAFAPRRRGKRIAVTVEDPATDSLPGDDFTR